MKDWQATTPQRVYPYVLRVTNIETHSSVLKHYVRRSQMQSYMAFLQSPVMADRYTYSVELE